MDRYENMEKFLQEMKLAALSSPNLELSRENLIYPSLVTMGIYKFGDISNLFDLWSKSRDNSFFDLNNPNFIGFNNGKISGNEIKLYIPIDFDFIYDCVNLLLNFLDSNNISYQLKVSRYLRNDNVCLRVNNLEDAFNVCTYIFGSPNFKSGRINPNPFIPDFNGIGFAIDNNYSFNSILSMLIQDFINSLKREDRLDLVSLSEFNKYVLNYALSLQEGDLKDLCLSIASSTSKDFKFDDFIMHARIKLANKYSSDRKKIEDPEFYFEQAIIETNKVSPENTKIAIFNYLKNNDTNYFTNRNNARDCLVEHVDPGIIINLMRSKLSKFGVTIPRLDSELIDSYLSILLNKENTFSGGEFKK